MLILTASDVAAVFDMASAFEAVEEAALAHVQGRTTSPPRTALKLPAVPAEFLVMPGAVDSQLFGLKVWYALRERAGSIPQSSALITLLDPELGLEILMDGGIITDLRTGAMSGLAASRLASPRSRTVGLIGAGIQAKAQAHAIVHACPEVDTVKVFSRDPLRRRKFAEMLNTELSQSYPDRYVGVVPTASAEDACRGSDVVVAATTSSTPVIPDGWIEDHALVCGVGSHAPEESEIDLLTVGRASRVVVDTFGGAIDGAGDIAAAINAGLISRDDVVELGTLLSEECAFAPGGGPTVFKSVGFGAADTVSARLVARRAVALGLGVTIDLHR
ncbi:MAG: Ornithine cyclodeaminase/alanine dehydrogenase [Homoserinimonas sp.]|nr:Ornithine cyclodeaminase/alanine dehydrogenase [Homoserinimonas sp.]